MSRPFTPLSVLTRPLVQPASQAPGSRIAYIDVAKCIGMVLVVWYHTGICPGEWVNSFFMPLFFFLSGVFFKPSDSPGVFMRKKLHELVLPFCFFLLLSLLLEWGVYDLEHLHKPVIEQWSFDHVGNVPLWFLLTLTYVSIIAYVVERWVKSAWVRIVIYALLMAAGMRLSQRYVIPPLYLGHVLITIPFFVCGYWLRDYIKRGRYVTLLTIIVAIALLLIGNLVDPPLMNVHRFNLRSWRCFPHIVGWILVVLSVSMVIARWCNLKVIQTVGRNTLMVLGLHDLLIVPIQQWIYPLLGWDTLYLPYWGVERFYSLAYAIVLTIICAVVGSRLRRAFPLIFSYKPQAERAQ